MEQKTPTIEIDAYWCKRFIVKNGWKVYRNHRDKDMWTDPLTDCIVSIESAMQVQLDRSSK